MGIREHDINVTLAALLHDIGKFYQRTGSKIDNSYYESFTKKGGYRHAAFTAQFIANFLDEKFSNLLIPSAEHHVTTNSVIKTADIIASGHDRKSEEAIAEEENNNYITARMYSIFTALFDIEQNEKKFINLKKQSNYFPDSKKDSNSVDESKRLYKNLFMMFTNEVKKISAKDHYHLYHKFYPLLREYTTAIPSSTFNLQLPTVSLYDHLRLTAAISNCLCKKNLNKDKPFVIIEYDLSGIQSFIFKITEGISTKPNIAKSLRTRSFYLSILCDFVTYAIVNEFDLTYENVLYTSGGRGRILVPNLEDSKEKINSIITKITKEMFIRHFTDLSFCFSSFELNEEELQEANFKKLMYGDNHQLWVQKSQKYLPLLKQNLEKFKRSPLNKACKLCETNEARGDYCDFCVSLLKFNDNILAKTDKFVIEFCYTDKEPNGGVVFSYGSLGKIIIHKEFNNELNLDINSYYESINCPLIGETKYYAQSNISGLSFEEIAEKSDGDPKLAVVKMDVDNLGWIFYKGFRPNKSTISKVLTLSRNMDFFFSKIIVDITKQNETDQKKYKDGIYIIYSGGDDLAVVLPASESLKFVDDVNKYFKKYTGNPNLHLSAGIEIFLPKSPIRFAIKRAEEQLENAKNTETKDSCGVLNEVVSNEKLPSILSEIKYYKDMLSKNFISRSGLYNIYLAISLSLDNKKDEFAFQRYIPNIAYSIVRNIEDKELLKKVKETFIRSNITRSDLQIYKIIYAYVLMITREVRK